MGNINVGRWVLGGVVAAIILFVVDWVLNGIILKQQWADAMAAMGKPAMGQSPADLILFAALNLIGGLAALWIYAGIRPRFGPGAMTAVYAGLAVWVVGYLVPYVFMMAAGLLPAVILWTGLIVGIFQVVIATVAGAYLYQEETAAPAM